MATEGINGKTYKKITFEVKSTYTLQVRKWGIQVTIADKYTNMPNTTFYKTQRFMLCKSSPTYDSIVKRIEHYYNVTR